MPEEKTESTQTPNNPVSAVVERLVSPAYNDLLQPSMQEIGKGLAGLAASWMHGWQAQGILARRNLETLESALSAKIEEIPEERRISPDPAIAIPAIQAVSYMGHHESLRDLFINLLASASDTQTSEVVHPSFIEIIKQMTPLEATILEYFNSEGSIGLVKLVAAFNRGENDASGHIIALSRIELDYNSCSVAVMNLIRLGLVEVSYERFKVNGSIYEDILSRLGNHLSGDEQFKDLKMLENVTRPREGEKGVLAYRRGVGTLTPLGKSFLKVCLTTSHD